MSSVMSLAMLEAGRRVLNLDLDMDMWDFVNVVVTGVSWKELTAAVSEWVSDVKHDLKKIIIVVVNDEQQERHDLQILPATLIRNNKVNCIANIISKCEMLRRRIDNFKTHLITGAQIERLKFVIGMLIETTHSRTTTTTTTPPQPQQNPAPPPTI